jgi:hypothetical protein
MLQTTASLHTLDVGPERRVLAPPRTAPAAIVVELADAASFGRLAERLALRGGRDSRGLCVLHLQVQLAPGASAPKDAAPMPQWLAECARRLRSRVRSTDTLARWDGTQFGVLLPGCASQHAAAVLARLIASASGPYRLGEKLLGLTVQGELQRCL